MASDTDKRLYGAIAILAVLGGAYFLVNKKEKEEAASYTLSGQNATLPKITISDDDIKAIDKIVLTKAGEDGGAGKEFELAKKGEEWRVVRPNDAAANQANVKSLLDNLKTLKVSEAVDTGKTEYQKYKVAEGSGLHVVISKGAAPVLDAVFGENGGRGQMARIVGKDGVYAIKGYSSYLYDRDEKGWRDTTVFKFEDSAVTSVAIENATDAFNFTKTGETWSAKHKKAGGAFKDLEKFDDAKVKDLLRAYKGLSADGFAEKGKTPADLGLEKPSATVSITLSDGAKRDVKIGATAEGSSRWVQATGVNEIVSISSWAADWGLAEAKKFQKSDDKKPEGGANPHAGGMPPGMGAPPGGDPHGH